MILLQTLFMILDSVGIVLNFICGFLNFGTAGASQQIELVIRYYGVLLQ